MNIAVAQLMQESNSFNHNPTKWEQCETATVTGNMVLTRYGQSNEISGFIQGTKRYFPVDTVLYGTAAAAFWPSGALDGTALTNLHDIFTREFKRIGNRVDALLFSLHGGTASENEPDVSGLFLETARTILGPETPIIATCDLHANITSRMVKNSTLICGYHTCPHLDMAKTGMRAVAALDRILRNPGPVHRCHRKLPMIVPTELQDTFNGPPAALFAKLTPLCQSEDILDVSIFMTQPWLDVPGLGWSVLVSGQGKESRLSELADELAGECWKLRGPLARVERKKAPEAIQMALKIPGKPVVIADGADATNSGASGDSTHLLREIASGDKIDGGTLVFFVDPDAVAKSRAAGTGSQVKLNLGGKAGGEYSRPFEFSGRVAGIMPAQYTLNGHLGENMPIDMGWGAVLEAENFTAVAVDRAGPGSTPQMYRFAGLEPRDYKIVIVKSPAGFRADFGPFAAGIILADCPGAASPHFENYDYRRISRPLFPLDKITDYRRADWTKELKSDQDMN